MPTSLSGGRRALGGGGAAKCGPALRMGAEGATSRAGGRRRRQAQDRAGPAKGHPRAVGRPATVGRRRWCHHADPNRRRLCAPTPLRRGARCSRLGSPIRRVTRSELDRVEVRGAGAKRIRRVLAHADGRSANPFESVLRALCIEAGLDVVPQAPIELPAGTVHPGPGVVLRAGGAGGGLLDFPREPQGASRGLCALQRAHARLVAGAAVHVGAGDAPAVLRPLGPPPARSRTRSTGGSRVRTAAFGVGRGSAPGLSCRSGTRCRDPRIPLLWPLLWPHDSGRSRTYAAARAIRIPHRGRAAGRQGCRQVGGAGVPLLADGSEGPRTISSCPPQEGRGRDDRGFGGSQQHGAGRLHVPRPVHRPRPDVRQDGGHARRPGLARRPAPGPVADPRPRLVVRRRADRPGVRGVLRR